MKSWLRTVGLALVFALVGAFTASLWLEIRQEGQALERARPGIWSGRRIRVEVLNGAGVDGLARRMTERLRERGFDVVYYGNAERFGYDTSFAVARVESLEPAWRVARTLGLRSVRQEPKRDLYLDVTVVLGADLAARDGADPPLEPGGSPTGAGRWWERIRRAADRLWPGD